MLGRGGDLPRDTLLIEGPFSFLRPYGYYFDIPIYDFDPKLPKKATPITGKADLEEDGSNLAIVLKNLIDSKAQKHKFSLLVQDMLPFVRDVKVEKFADKSLLFSLRESYGGGHYLPASLISDGTINIAALIAILYFQESRLTVIEEPERNLHPSLISRLLGMMKDASSKKQLLVTTHNPEMIKHADLADILLVSRSAEGFSTITRPAESDELRIFLQNEIGVDELYVQNLLNVPAGV